MKLVFRLFGGLVALLLVVLIVVWFSLGAIIKSAVERVGPEVTGTEVRLDSAKLSIFDGEGALQGFLIGNPSGFEYPNAFTLGLVGLKVDTSTITDDVIVINSVHIEAPKITYESGEAGDNFKALLNNIQQRVGTTDTQAETEAEAAAGSEKKIIIEEFLLADGDITISHTMLEKDLNVPMPDLVLTDIGRNTNGATAAQAARQIFEQISEAVTKAVAESALMEAARQQLEKARQEAEAKIDEMKQEAEQQLDEAKQDAEERLNEELENSEELQQVQDQLDGLFK